MLFSLLRKSDLCVPGAAQASPTLPPLPARGCLHTGRCGARGWLIVSQHAFPRHILSCLAAPALPTPAQPAQADWQLPPPTQPAVALPSTNLHTPHSGLSSLQPPRSGVLKIACFQIEWHMPCAMPLCCIKQQAGCHMGCAWCGMCTYISILACSLVLWVVAC
jgi:hypothetical protein